MNASRAKWRVPKPTAAPTGVKELPEEGAEALPVRVVIEQDGFVTGWDEGALGFDEGAMWFSGECSSFRVIAADLGMNWMSRDERVQRGVVLRHPTRLVRLRFVFLVPVWEERAHAESLRAGLERLGNLSRRPRSKTRSEYPPLAPRPGAVVWRPRTDMLPSPGSLGPLASWLERTGLTRILASDVAFLRELRLRRRLLNEIEREEAAR